MNRTAHIIASIVILIVIGVVSYLAVFYFTKKDESQSQVEKTLNYLFLTDNDAGTSSPIMIPSEFIIQLSQESATVSSTTVSDPDSIINGLKIESYNSYTIVSGSLTKLGAITIETGSTSLPYTFIAASTSTPTSQ